MLVAESVTLDRRTQGFVQVTLSLDGKTAAVRETDKLKLPLAFSDAESTHK